MEIMQYIRTKNCDVLKLFDCLRKYYDHILKWSKNKYNFQNLNDQVIKSVFLLWYLAKNIHLIASDINK